VVLIVGILLVGFVVAQGEGANGIGQGVGVDSGNDFGVGSAVSVAARVMAGNYVGEGGQMMMIQKKTNNRVQLRVNDISADCGLNLTQKQVKNKTKLEAKLSNGRNAEVKIMPDVASVRALERLRMRN